MTVLLLGGTSEARELAVLLDEAGVDFVSSLAGRVERPRLASLDAATLRDLINQGDMDCVYAHLLSQDNFLRLVARRGLFNKA